MRAHYLFDLREHRLPRTIGNKAEKLRFLVRKGFSCPPTHVCTWDAYLRYLEDEPGLIEVLRYELASTLDEQKFYAVRSSANIEDQIDQSFAGQFKSVLNARGTDQILESIWAVWATARSPAVERYLDKHTLDIDDLKMAVVIQEMVDPVISGVSFSRNPVTGMDETVVEAVDGYGEALVQQGVTPRRWVSKWGAWTSRPEDDESDHATDIIEQVVRETKAISEAYGGPVDLEWVYDGSAVTWVQLRDITALDVDLYSNRISREVFPGIIVPLVWSVNVPLVNGAWVKLLTELIGPNDIAPEDLARSFYYRAYFNMGTLGRIFEMLGFPRESLELLMGIEIGGEDRPSFRPTWKTYSLLPRLIRFAAQKLRFESRIEAFLPKMEAEYQSLPLEQIEHLSAEDIIAEVDRLYDLNRHTAYYNIVTPLLMQAYNQALKRELERSGVDFTHVDLGADGAQLAEFDPNPHLAQLSRQYQELAEPVQRRIRATTYDELSEIPGASGFRESLDQFIAQFGHLSDSGNDFSSIPWREDPDLVLNVVTNYTATDRVAARNDRVEDLDIPLLRRAFVRWLYRRARRFRRHREAVSSLYTFGYGLFRVYFLALGKRFTEKNLLDAPDDIFYLHLQEVKEIVAGAAETDYRPAIARRKEELRRSEDLVPPSLIYGDVAHPPALSTSGGLSGTPTSRGLYTGKISVIQSIREFDALKDGDVLVIPYSDVGWSPLFARAGAVVSESGGLLSHTSIVAREYGIPAVVSVPGACQLQDGTLVTVDGYRGEVTVHESVDRHARGAMDSQEHKVG